MTRTLPTLRILIGALVVLPIVAVSLSLILLSGYTSRRIESHLSSSLVQATSTVVGAEIHDVLRDAQWISNLYLYRIEKGLLPLEHSPAWDRMMIGTLSMRSSLASIIVGLPDGRAWTVSRIGDRFVVGRSDGPGPGQTRDYHVDSEMNVEQQPWRSYQFDAVARPWYQRAATAPTAAFTPLYVWYDESNRPDGPPIAALGYARPVRDAAGQLLAVLAVDVHLDTVSDRLRDSDLARHGTLLLIDEQGRLVSDSGGVPTDQLLPHIDQINLPDVHVLRRVLKEFSGDQSSAEIGRILDDRYVSVRSIKPYRGIDWKLAAVVPQSHFNAETAALRRDMGLLSVVCVVGALLLGLLLARWVSEPVSRMVAAVRRIGRDGNFDVDLESQPTREMADLTHALEEMTAQLKEQVSLRAAKEAAESANRAKSAFFARATHELRTPLNAIIGYAELLEEQDAVRGNAQSRDDIRRVLQASRHLLRVINDVLDMAKIESGKLSISLTDVGLPTLLREVQETAQPLAEHNGNTLRLQVSDNIGVLRTDPDKLRQILLNLLANAARFTESGTILLLAEQDQAHLHLAVSDTGCGIPAESLGHLYEPFFQADNFHGGTGLGLPIVRQLVGALGGAMELSSVVGQGTTVDLYFPLHLPTPEAEPVLAEGGGTIASEPPAGDAEGVLS